MITYINYTDSNTFKNSDQYHLISCAFECEIISAIYSVKSCYDDSALNAHSLYIYDMIFRLNKDIKSLPWLAHINEFYLNESYAAYEKALPATDPKWTSKSVLSGDKQEVTWSLY